ncbi:uncharacterized protein LOC114544248 [Dendronephthya gigantea]|uniref:uncharacterized protein LOC114544248 n=1 Tax=Dendronephthya gigantea TaxID=151771 RepID=UPI00106CA83C|nr:uncharacterized protein LOC114544248 [Dendronephthya gigantea]
MYFRYLRQSTILSAIFLTLVVMALVNIISFWRSDLSNNRRYLRGSNRTYLSESSSLVFSNANKISKKFLYLLQTETCMPEHLKNANAIGNSSSCNCDVLILGYKSSCNEASPEHVQHVHDPNTTWSTGRNLLYDIAMKRTTKYLYYIYLDDDILLKPSWENDREVNSDNSWRFFERFLLEYTPPVGITGFCNANFVPSCKRPDKPAVIRIQGLFDAAFNAFHVKALPYLLPYITKYEDISWWYSQHYLHGFATVNFKGEGVVSNEAITAVNIKHRNYPRRDANVETLKFIMQDVVEIVKRKNLPEIVWRGKKVTRVVLKRRDCSCYL